jgi:hypothetical protein
MVDNIVLVGIVGGTLGRFAGMGPALRPVEEIRGIVAIDDRQVGSDAVKVAGYGDLKGKDKGSSRRAR